MHGDPWSKLRTQISKFKGSRVGFRIQAMVMSVCGVGLGVRVQAP